MNYWELKKTFKLAFLSRIAQRMRTVKECAEMKNPRAKRAKLLFFIFKFSKRSCHPLFVLLVYLNKQRIRKRKKKIAKNEVKERRHPCNVRRYDFFRRFF